jgi:predicted MFS family arabinose efflux permease
MGFSLLFVMVGTFNYMNFYLAAAPFGLNPAQLGAVFLVYSLAFFMTPAAGRFMDLHGFRKTILLSFFLVSIGLLLTLKLRLSVIMVGLSFVAAGCFALQAATTTHLGLIAGRTKAGAMGLYVTFYYVGGSVGAALPAYFWARWGWHSTVAIMLIMVTVTLTFGFVASRKAPVVDGLCVD